MTDKQIIIDGKECRYWFRPNPSDYRKCSLRGKNDDCDKINDCFIKELLGKLLRKEQECEELRRSITKIFACLIKANRAKIIDTLWVDDITTLWDYIALTLGIEGDQTQIEEQILQKISEYKGEYNEKIR